METSPKPKENTPEENYEIVSIEYRGMKLEGFVNTATMLLERAIGISRDKKTKVVIVFDPPTGEEKEIYLYNNENGELLEFQDTENVREAQRDLTEYLKDKLEIENAILQSALRGEKEVGH